MPRLLFEKTGSAIWMSHLDLMRVFQRAFKRAGLPLKHTQGFNPRPSVSIALPLSVGVDSVCELLDFELDGMEVSCDEITDRLNTALVSGVRVHKTYQEGRKLRDLLLLDCKITMEYDNGIPDGAESALKELFARQSLIVTKKTKNGMQDQDIIPMIRKLDIKRVDGCVVEVMARICCQNPTLNPAQIITAVSVYMPQFRPDFTKCSRLEIMDAQEEIFR